MRGLKLIRCGHGRRGYEGAVDRRDGVGCGVRLGLNDGFREDRLGCGLVAGGSKALEVWAGAAVIAVVSSASVVTASAVVTAATLPVTAATVVAAGATLFGPVWLCGGGAGAEGFAGEDHAAVPGSGKGEIRDRGGGCGNRCGCGLGGAGAVLGEGLAGEDEGLDGPCDLRFLAIGEFGCGFTGAAVYLVEAKGGSEAPGNAGGLLRAPVAFSVAAALTRGAFRGGSFDGGGNGSYLVDWLVVGGSGFYRGLVLCLGGDTELLTSTIAATAATATPAAAAVGSGSGFAELVGVWDGDLWGEVGDGLLNPGGLDTRGVGAVEVATVAAGGAIGIEIAVAAIAASAAVAVAVCISGWTGGVKAGDCLGEEVGVGGFGGWSGKAGLVGTASAISSLAAVALAAILTLASAFIAWGTGVSSVGVGFEVGGVAGLFHEVRDVEEGVALQANVHEGGLHAGQDAGDSAVIDGAGEGVFVLALVVDLGEGVAFDDGEPGLMRRGGDIDFFRHCSAFCFFDLWSGSGRQGERFGGDALAGARRGPPWCWTGAGVTRLRKLRMRLLLLRGVGTLRPGTCAAGRGMGRNRRDRSHGGMLQADQRRRR